MTTVVPDDADFFKMGQHCPSLAPQDRPTWPGPDLDSEYDPQPQPTAPVPDNHKRSSSSYLDYLTYSAHLSRLDNYLSHLGYWNYLTHHHDFCVDAAWLKSVGSRVLFELDPKKPVLYVVPVESILGKLPVGDFGTVPHRAMVCARNFPARSQSRRRPHARRRRRLSCVVCQIIGSGLDTRDVIYSFVQVNTQIPGNWARRRRRAPPQRRRLHSLKYSLAKLQKSK